MYDSQRPYVELWDRLSQGGPDPHLRGAIDPWLTRVAGERAWLRRLAESFGDPPRRLADEDGCRLYALSRCLDVIVTALTAPRPGAVPSDLTALATGLGLRVVSPVRFHPFDCEIHRVDQAPDADLAPTLRRVDWPSLRLGPLMVLRAGVTVRAGRDHVVKVAAEQGPLYWAHRRNRPCTDLSAGWGHNSQWRTALRSDFALGTGVYYNLRGRAAEGADPEAAMPGLAPQERDDLVRHRCDLKGARPDPDLWPYDHAVVERRAA